MAALMKEAPTKSFFSSPSHTFKKLVNAFPKSQKQSHYPQQQQQQKLVEEEDDDEEADAADIIHCLADENEDYEDEEEHKQNSSAAEEDGGVDIECTGSSEGEYPRPRIREDLLPHDFSAWQKSPSIAPYPPSEASSTSREAESFSEVLSSSTSQERHPRINGHVKLNRNPSPNRTAAMDSSPIADLHLHKVRQNLPDLKLETIIHGVSAANGGSKYGGPAGLKGLPEDWKSLRNGASEDSRYRCVDGSWQLRKELDSAVAGGQLREKMQDLARTGNGRELYQNLVEMFPLIETCMERPEDNHQRANFQHRSSMVYTRAPSRETLAKKVADSANSRRASRNSRRVKKKSEAVWEEQENLPRRFKVDDSSLSPRSISYENAVDIAKLQGQVDELQHKLVVREGMLESYHRFEEPKDESSDVIVLARRVEELQREVAEKEYMWESAREKLTQKENEIQGMQMLLKSSEESYVGLRARSASSEEEVRALRCEVAALRWQFEIDAESMGRQCEPSTEVCNDRKFHCDTVGKQQQEPDVVEMEAVRKMYLASLVVARHVPREEECLALVGVLRIQLQCFLRRPTFHIP